MSLLYASADRMNGQEFLSDLDYSSYFQLVGMPLPDGHAEILDALERDRLINRSDAGRFDITNLGASLFATSLDSFPRLLRGRSRAARWDRRRCGRRTSAGLPLRGSCGGCQWPRGRPTAPVRRRRRCAARAGPTQDLSRSLNLRILDLLTTHCAKRRNASPLRSARRWADRQDRKRGRTSTASRRTTFLPTHPRLDSAGALSQTLCDASPIERRIDELPVCKV